VTLPPIVCLHGLGRSARDWDTVRPRLEQLGRVIAPDLPRDTARAGRIAGTATPTGAVLIGHSIGAVLALQLARDPSRRIRGIVVSSSFFPPALNGRSLPVAVADYAGHRLAFVRDLRTSSHRPRPRRGSGTGIWSLVRAAGRGRDFLANKTPAISAPVLVVHADDDHYVPIAFALSAVASQPAWQLARLDHGGHYPQLRCPEDWLATVIPWLQQLEAGASS
jgi:pimeloyl-ACP methyl ester carboxylesterase